MISKSRGTTVSGKIAQLSQDHWVEGPVSQRHRSRGAGERTMAQESIEGVRERFAAQWLRDVTVHSRRSQFGRYTVGAGNWGWTQHR